MIERSLQRSFDTGQNNGRITYRKWAGIAQLVQQLAAGWTAWGSNPAGGREFPHPSWPFLGPNQPITRWVPGHYRGVKQLGHGTDHPPQSRAKVEGRVKLYIYSPSGPSWPVLGWPFILRTNNANLTLPRTILPPLTYADFSKQHLMKAACRRSALFLLAHSRIFNSNPCRQMNMTKPASSFHRCFENGVKTVPSGKTFIPGVTKTVVLVQTFIWGGGDT